MDAEALAVEVILLVEVEDTAEGTEVLQGVAAMLRTSFRNDFNAITSRVVCV